jgi:tetratricopeptide (TPR) repeat protein
LQFLCLESGLSNSIQVITLALKRLLYSDSNLSMNKFPWYIFASIVFLAACTTQKKRGEVSGFKKKYHNTTAYYNGFFNAEILVEESTEQLNLQHKDNYNKVLDMYKYSASENPQAVYGSLDKAIEKVSVIVHLHRVSDWTDDCYLMLGKAQYLKQDFESAQETLEFFAQEFNADGSSKSLKKATKTRKSGQRSTTRPTAPAKSKAQIKAEQKEAKQKKKEREKQIKQRQKGGKVSAKDAQAIREARRAASQKAEPGTENESSKTEPIEPFQAQNESVKTEKTSSNKTPGGEEYKPDSYFMKHKPCYQEGMLWLARTYVERANYDNARMYIKQLEFDPKTFDEIRAECAAVEAYSFLKQKNYQLAVLPLRKAVELTSDRKERARFGFILGQLLERTGNHPEAVQAFEKVIKARPDYEMDFHARLGVIVNKHKSGAEGPDALTRELERMLKERKYVDFKDQLYFTLAKVSLDSKNSAKAIENLELALEQPNGSQSNKVEIHYTLATLYHSNEQYVQAKTHYDQALNGMSKTDERYHVCMRNASSLSEIAANIKIIQHQDSLLGIAALSDNEKMELAKKIKKQREEEKQADLDKAAKDSKSGSNPPAYTPPPGRTLFFAYDTRNQKKNQRDFEKKWGNRPLEDDWRRKNKFSSSFDIVETEEGSTRSSGKMSELEIKDILKDIPDSPGAVAEANDKVLDAMFALGRLYRDKLASAEKSLDILDKLEARYPENRHEADVYYLLYLDHLDLNNPAKANYYKALILDKHSESIYAEVFRDPDYFKKKKEEENRLKNYYANAFDHFSKGNFEKAYNMSVESTKLFGNTNEMRSKFALMNAMCVGNMKGVDDYMTALREVIAKYPNTEEQTRAREILRLLGQRTPGDSSVGSGKDTTLPALAKELYSNTPDDLHYVLVVLQESSMTLDIAKNKISDFNKQFYSLDQLKISNIVLGENNQLPVVVVRRFNNKASAMKYFDAIQKNRKDFIENPTLYEVFAISQSNYRNLVSARSVEAYRDFFMQTYLN